MEDRDSVLEHLSRSKRRELFQFLREHDTEDSRVLLAGDPRELPKSSRTDRGTIALLYAGTNIYNPQYRDFLVLVDTLDRDGRETFQKFYKRQEVVFAFLGAGQQDSAYYRVPREKSGRPRRTLTDSEIQAILEMRKNGMSVNAIATRMKIGNRRVMDVARNHF